MKHLPKITLGGLITIAMILSGMFYKGITLANKIEENEEVNVEQKVQIEEIKKTNNKTQVHLAGLEKSVDGIEKIQQIILNEVKKINGSN